ncbi:MAG: tRNA pseudouridine(38-40) synthase TruA [Clostridia bacterium]|nr:tRNA pseudouridine(38-40) synthase TruA [Clostridia bacterium]MDD4375959.1 tRNA pseudouridine(38-40) synthase TruA [Clostridia bacterium]
MRNVKLVIEYSGTGFFGWQKQPDKRTIQEEIEKTLECILKEKVELIGSGRTDAGVHAMGQVANFYTNKSIKCEELLMAVNSVIEKDITILSVEDVEIDFHSRKSAKEKHYRYVVNNSKIHSALNQNREMLFKHDLDIEIMNVAKDNLIGKHNFAAFRAVGSSVCNTERTIYELKINKLGNRIIFDIVGSGFMYNMVRIIVGTLLDIGSGKLEASTIKNMIETGKRALGGQTVPPDGLYMVSVKY